MKILHHIESAPTLFAIVFLITGCGDDVFGETDTDPTETAASEATESSGSSGSSSGDPGVTSTTGVASTSTGEDPYDTTFGVTGSGGMTMADTADTCGFICESTGTGGVSTDKACDVFAQDCPEGEKCAAYAEGGGSSWNATKCVPVTGEGVPGDVCTTEGGGVSGLDDCQKGAFCWDVDEENKGICVELCGGTEAAPTCSDEASFNCAVVNEGVLNLCLPNCDPLVQDCAGDDLCIPVGDTFVCVLDASGADAGKQFDPCEFANACDKGLLCLNPSAAMECDPNAGGCCMPFCDLSDPEANANCDATAKGTNCLSLYAEGMAPPEFEDVGICALPE